MTQELHDVIQVALRVISSPSSTDLEISHSLTTIQISKSVNDQVHAVLVSFLMSGRASENAIETVCRVLESGMAVVEEEMVCKALESGSVPLIKLGLKMIMKETDTSRFLGMPFQVHFG